MATVAERIELLHNNLAHVEAMGGEKKVEKQHAKGKLTARERLALLFDEGSFVEVNALVKSRCYNFGQEKKDRSYRSKSILTQISWLFAMWMLADQIPFKL